MKDDLFSSSSPRSKCGSCYCDPFENLIYSNEEKAKTKQRRIHVGKRFLSTNLKTYILSDSSLTSDGGGEFIGDDDLSSMTSSISDFPEKDPENDSGHEDDTVFLMENPETSPWEANKHGPKSEQRNSLVESISIATVEEGKN